MKINIHTTHGSVHNTKDGSSRRYVETYEQPFFWFALATLYHFYDMKVWKIPGFKRLVALDQRLHNRHCNDDCMTGEVWTRGRGQRVETYCAHMPLDVRQDLRCFELSQKQRREIQRDWLEEGTFQEALDHFDSLASNSSNGLNTQDDPVVVDVEDSSASSQEGVPDVHP